MHGPGTMKKAFRRSYSDGGDRHGMGALQCDGCYATSGQCQGQTKVRTAGGGMWVVKTLGICPKAARRNVSCSSPVTVRADDPCGPNWRGISHWVPG